MTALEGKMVLTCFLVVAERTRLTVVSERTRLTVVSERTRFMVVPERTRLTVVWGQIAQTFTD